jgi:hypothetical protein
MPARTAASLGALLADSDTYLEYGVGGSTRLAASAGPRTLIGVDSDARFLAAAGQVVNQENAVIDWHPVHVDVGPTGYLGFPTSLRSRPSWGHYASAPWGLGLVPDLVLVDGRFRLACALAAARHAEPGTLVFFDDYRTRPWYWRVESFLDLVEKVGRAAVFRVRTVRPRGLDEAIRSAAANPL